jgi:hypothetical protein
MLSMRASSRFLVGETYHRHRKRRWKKRVQRFHE